MMYIGVYYSKGMVSNRSFLLCSLLCTLLSSSLGYDIDCYHCNGIDDCLTPGSTECSYRHGCIKITAKNKTVVRQGCSPIETKSPKHDIDLQPYGLSNEFDTYACWSSFCNAMDSSSLTIVSSFSLFLLSIIIGLSL